MECNPRLVCLEAAKDPFNCIRRYQIIASREIRKPDFFIVGAPKCGTTAMNHYLSQHPDIFMAPKELHFFGSDLRFRYPRCSEEEYLSYFHIEMNKKRLGETSVCYLYSKQAAYEIKTFFPFASIIIMLRNPVDMIYSLYSHQLYNGSEDIEDFEAALDAEKDRKLGLRVPETANPIDGLLYQEIAKYTDQVKRYFDVFARENVHLIIFDEFKKDTHKVYSETLRFLGVDHSFSSTFNIINSNKRARSKLVRNFVVNPPEIARWVARSLMPRPLRQQLIKDIKKYNTEYLSRPPVNPKLYCRLQGEFGPEVEHLSELLGRDLTYWCK